MKTFTLEEAPPILTCAEAREFEARHFAGVEAREWAAMQAAGRGVADAALADFLELGDWPAAPRVLVLAGKGHNAGDALLAAARVRQRIEGTRIDVILALGERGLRPLARRALQELAGEIRFLRAGGADWAAEYDLCFDGVFGHQFRAPSPPACAELFSRVNAHPVRLRAAVDLPSGLDGPGAFRADFCYATGIAKAPLLVSACAGRPRYLDLGFFEAGEKSAGEAAPHPAADRVLTRGLLRDLAQWRAPRGDKRDHGHVLVVAGSRRYPGAALLTVLGALQAGAGLVSAAVPESFVPAFAARAPEAIWIGLPETPEGGLALEGLMQVREAGRRASALVIGPGLGGEKETLALAREIVAGSALPMVIDADALRPEIVGAGSAARVLTPHGGESARLGAEIPEGAVVVRKGPLTRIEIAAGGGGRRGPAGYSFFGGPVLSRGGSGDILAGLIGALLAQTPGDAPGAAARGVVWQGLAADALARARGATAVRSTQLLDFLGPALRACGA
jgi:NAD(P)H-hydrate epimerase